MMDCPKCGHTIPADRINVKTDLAHCANCNEVLKLSTLFGSTTSFQEDEVFDVEQVPKGCWHKRDRDTIVFGATTRSPIAFFLVPFMLVWSGFSLGGIYGPQIASGNFNAFTSLVGIPFILGSIFFWAITLMAVFGKSEVTVDNYGGRIFTGIGKVGMTRKFDWTEIQEISEISSKYKYPGASGSVISIQGQKRISFANGINSDRKYYLTQALKYYLNKKKKRNYIV